MSRTHRGRRWPALVLGLGLGGAIGGGAMWAFYADWHAIAPPLAQEPLVLRADAKGSGRFGAPRSGNRRHHGVDIEAPLGSPVRAIRSGIVIASGNHRGLGRYLELEHRNGFRSLYAHLNAMAVDVGERVRQGQVIATVGKTGNAKSSLIKPHLHLAVFREGDPIDPASLGLALAEPSERTDNADADGGE